MLSEKGNQSAMRGMTCGIVSIVVLTWAYVSIIKQELQPLDVEQVTLVLGALGAKAWQKGKENG